MSLGLGAVRQNVKWRSLEEEEGGGISVLKAPEGLRADLRPGSSPGVGTSAVRWGRGGLGGWQWGGGRHPCFLGGAGSEWDPRGLGGSVGVLSAPQCEGGG